MDEIRNASTVDEMLRALSAAGLETERAADQVAQRGLGSLPVRLNGRFKAKLGRCSQRGGSPILIELATVLLDNLDQLRATFLHELGHAIDCAASGRFNGHGLYWEAHCRSIGLDRPRARSEYDAHLPVRAHCVACGWEMRKARPVSAQWIEQRRHTRCDNGFLSMGPAPARMDEIAA